MSLPSLHPDLSQVKPTAGSTNTQVFERFADNRLFQGIERDLLGEMIGQIECKRFAKGEVVFREGERGDVLYLVGEGSVKISKLGRGGGQETLGFIEAGDFFGEMALLDSEPRSAMAAAAAPTVLGIVNEPMFQRVLEVAPSRLHRNFLQSVTQRLRDINSHFITEVMRTERLSMIGSMAGMIMHDLNNPITTVRCCCDLLDRANATPELLESATLLKSAVNGMLAMTQELLDYTRGSICLNKEQVGVPEIFEEVFRQFRPQLKAQKVELVCDLRYAGLIAVDRARFQRVLGNLIKNAREAMPAGGVLSIKVERTDDRLRLRVGDTGVGIPEEILPKLFEPFVTHGKANGTGLGMAIAKSVVEAHEGKITVASVRGRGTEIEISLPFASGL